MGQSVSLNGVTECCVIGTGCRLLVYGPPAVAQKIPNPVLLVTVIWIRGSFRDREGAYFYCTLLVYLSPGTEILTVQAADNDDPKTDNVRIFYRLVGQIPESPRALFRVDRDSGVISVQADSMEGTAPQYTLTITAEDAKGDYRLVQRYCLPVFNLSWSHTGISLSNLIRVRNRTKYTVSEYYVL